MWSMLFSWIWMFDAVSSGLTKIAHKFFAWFGRQFPNGHQNVFVWHVDFVIPNFCSFVGVLPPYWKRYQIIIFSRSGRCCKNEKWLLTLLFNLFCVTDSSTYCSFLRWSRLFQSKCIFTGVSKFIFQTHQCVSYLISHKSNSMCRPSFLGVCVFSAQTFDRMGHLFCIWNYVGEFPAAETTQINQRLTATIIHIHKCERLNDMFASFTETHFFL